MDSKKYRFETLQIHAGLQPDEPTGALDSRTGREVLGFLQKLNAEGDTVVLITHDNSIAVQAQRIIRLEDGMVEIQGVTFTSHSCTVVYRLTAPNGEEAAETPPFYWKLIQGEAGPKESPFSSFVEPSRNGQDLGGNLGWEEVLEGEKRGSTYQVFTISVEEDMSQVEDPKLLLYFSRAVDGVPSADDVPGGTLLTVCTTTCFWGSPRAFRTRPVLSFS